MKNKEIRELTPDELRARKRELREQIFHLRLQQAGGQLEKPSELRSLRRDVVATDDGDGIALFDVKAKTAGHVRVPPELKR